MLVSIEAHTGEWEEHRGQHFIVYAAPGSNREWINEVIRMSEKYYSKIADQLEYTRYTDFWTWDRRTSIYLYPDQETFARHTGLPKWSSGAAKRDYHVRSSRSIVTYVQEENFMDGVLPHEISHLILLDYFGQNKDIPIWLNEGIAQLQESKKLELARKVMPQFVAKGEYFSWEHLFNYDIRQETDRKLVAEFYVQSISVLDFLIDSYGNSKFAELCREMSHGRSFKEAYRITYEPLYGPLTELEKKWLSYMKNK